MIPIAHEDLAPHIGRARLIFEPRRRDDPQLVEEMHLRRDVLLERHPLLEDLRQARPVLLALEPPLELRERLGVMRLRLEHALPQRDRRVWLAQLLARELRQLDQALVTLLAIAEEPDLALGNRDVRIVVAALIVDILEDADRLAVLGLVREDRLVVLDRLGGVREALDHDAGDLRMQVDELLRVRLVLDLLLQDLHEIRPALHLGVLGRQRVERADVAGVDLEDRLPRRNDLRGRIHLDLVDVDHLHEEQDLVIHIGGPKAVEALLEELDHRVPFPDRGVQATQRLIGLVVLGHELAQLLPELDRLLVLLLLLGQPRQEAPRFDRVLDAALLRLRQDLLESPPVVLRRVELDVERPQELGRLGPIGQRLDTAEGHLGHLLVAETLP